MTEFFKLSDMGDATESGRKRSCVSLLWDPLTAWRLVEAQPIDAGFPEIAARSDSGPDLEDMPWADGTGQVVSDRLRRLLLRHAPDHAQFLPMTVLCGKRPLPPHSYWMTNWLFMVDCFDRVHSDYVEVKAPHEPGGKRLSFNRLVINRAAVPSEVRVCRIKYYENRVIIRQELRQILDDEGITGCQYYEVAQT